MVLGSSSHPVSIPQILLMDYNEEDLRHWSHTLKESSFNYSVLESTSVESALNVCRENVVDCVLLDLDMPVSGFHALLELIPNPAQPPIAVIVLTHLYHPHLFELAKENGAQACLLKRRTSTKDLDMAIQQAILTVKSTQENSGGRC